MDLGLKGRRALVLGASRGLGAASAVLLAEEGAEVLAVSRSGALPENAPQDAGIRTKAVDLSDPAALAAFIEEIKAEGFDILVASSGGPAAGPAAAQSATAWEGALRSLALPVFAVANALLDGMTAKGWGRIVTIGSSGIEAPIPNLALSNGIRGAVAGWSKTLAAEVAAKGVTVNMVLPGRIGTDRVAELDTIAANRQGKSFEEVEAASRATIPLGRYGKPEEFAAAVVFLCGQPASYITGSMLRVDGGLIRSL